MNAAWKRAYKHDYPELLESTHERWACDDINGLIRSGMLRPGAPERELVKKLEVGKLHAHANLFGTTPLDLRPKLGINVFDNLLLYNAELLLEKGTFFNEINLLPLRVWVRPYARAKAPEKTLITLMMEKKVPVQLWLPYVCHAKIEGGYPDQPFATHFRAEAMRIVQLSEERLSTKCERAIATVSEYGGTMWSYILPEPLPPNLNAQCEWVCDHDYNDWGPQNKPCTCGICTDHASVPLPLRLWPIL